MKNENEFAEKLHEMPLLS